MKVAVSTLVVMLLLLTLPDFLHAGFALEFDGNDDFVSLDHRALDGLTSCTVEYWSFIIREN